MKRNAATFLLLLLVACFSATVIADGYNPNPRPITGLLSGDAYWVPEEYCDGVNYEPSVGSPLTTVSTFFGEVSHLGSSEFHTIHCSTNTGQYLLRGVGTLIAANGDELWLEYSAEAISPVVIPGTIVYEIVNVVVGGTGRFEDASGVIQGLVFVTLTIDDEGNPNAQADMELAGSFTF